ncbi:hypothetical protein FEF22_000100 [Texas Phoenix palm phytoplasma]|uniref:Uncharacterized protein n=1 Tax=Texas Phoenix palm phytoplasma TaxID=176709 RepID=A0ABS5BHY6_9MOLU|nr:hypothetical protein [Texas Phoenix palm phytoplasma]MBP3059193.1 hypothetical protein [Texas Phoenix palm phytoplasma]
MNFFEIFQLSKYMIYFICIFIIFVVVFTSEKSMIDVFAEQYGNYKTNPSETFLNYSLFLLILILFYNSYFYLQTLSLFND